MSTTTDARTVRLREIAKRWPRFAWDYRGLARWQSFDESFWMGLLAAGALFATGYSDLPVWWGKIPFLLPVLSEAGGTPRGNILLSVLILLNVWVLDRLLANKAPAGLSEVHWVRAVRVIASSIPLLGLAVIPVWQELIRRRPSWAFVHRSGGSPLLLHESLPSRLGPAGWWTRMDARLRSWSQHLIPQILWLVGCQLTPLFSGLYLLSQSWPAPAMAVNVLLHLTGAASAAAHVAVRIQILQMTGRRALFFRLLPLVLLLPVPFSSIAALIWFPSAEPEKEDKGIVQTLYHSRIPRRHPLAAVRGPRIGEITGSRETGRRRSAAIKVGLLALESAVLAGIAASFGSSSLPRSIDDVFLMRLAALAVLPGVFLILAGAVARTSGHWPRFGFLADHPYGSFLTFLPLSLMVGISAGTLAASHNLPAFRLLWLEVGFAGILTTLLAMMWTFLFSLFFGVPERPFTGIVACFTSSVLLMLLVILLRDPPIRPLSGLIVLASPLSGILVASRWLAPFRFRDLNDRRLPARIRVRLWGLAITAILPLGGLAVPGWIWMRHRHGPELDQWAARLREPVV